MSNLRFFCLGSFASLSRVSSFSLFKNSLKSFSSLILIDWFCVSSSIWLLFNFLLLDLLSFSILFGVLLTWLSVLLFSNNLPSSTSFLGDFAFPICFLSWFLVSVLWLLLLSNLSSIFSVVFKLSDLLLSSICKRLCSNSSSECIPVSVFFLVFLTIGSDLFIGPLPNKSLLLTSCNLGFEGVVFCLGGEISSSESSLICLRFLDTFFLNNKLLNN